MWSFHKSILRKKLREPSQVCYDASCECITSPRISAIESRASCTTLIMCLGSVFILATRQVTRWGNILAQREVDCLWLGNPATCWFELLKDVKKTSQQLCLYRIYPPPLRVGIKSSLKIDIGHIRPHCATSSTSYVEPIHVPSWTCETISENYVGHSTTPVWQMRPVLAQVLPTQGTVVLVCSNFMPPAITCGRIYI